MYNSKIQYTISGVVILCARWQNPPKAGPLQTLFWPGEMAWHLLARVQHAGKLARLRCNTKIYFLLLLTFMLLLLILPVVRVLSHVESLARRSLVALVSLLATYSKTHERTSREDQKPKCCICRRHQADSLRQDSHKRRSKS